MSGRRESSAAGMHCDRARELLPRYVDGELNDAQATVLRQHLLGCPGCRKQAAEGRSLQRWFEPESGPAVPEGFSDRVMAAIQGGDAPGVVIEPQRPRPERVRSSGGQELGDFVLWATAAAAGVLLALSILLGLRNRPTGDALMAEPIGEVLLELEALNARGADAPSAEDAR